MCSNFELAFSRVEASAEYGVAFEVERQQYFPYRPTKAQAPAKAYALPPVVFEQEGAGTGSKSS